MKSISFILLFILYPYVYAETTGNQSDLIRLSAKQIQSYGITVSKPETVSEVLGETYPAQVIVPNSQLQVISARQGGLIEALLVAKDDPVKKGQVLARIQSPFLLQLQRDLLQTLTKLNLSRSTQEREKKLMEEGIIPKRRYQEALGVFQTLQTQKEQQETALQYAGMTNEDIRQLEKTRKLNSVLEVTAPFDGVLLEQMGILGQKLAAADPIFQIAQLSPLWLEVHVPVEVANRVSIGDFILIPNLNSRGEIITLGHKVHAADQGILVRAIVRENIDQLRPGQFVRTHILKKMSTKNYQVPTTAVVRIEKKTVIFLQVEEGFKMINVEVLGKQKGLQVISSEQPVNHPIVINGAVVLKAILSGTGDEES